MTMEPATEAAYRLVVASLASYCTAGDDDSGVMDPDVIHEHIRAYVARCVESVSHDADALAELVPVIIGRLLLTSGFMFKVVFETLVDTDPAAYAEHRARMLAVVADGAASLLAVAESDA